MVKMTQCYLICVVRGHDIEVGLSLEERKSEIALRFSEEKMELNGGVDRNVRDTEELW
jgi:hypothetical protein